MEIEFKFLIPEHRLEGVEAALQQGPFTACRMEAHYFDTPEGDLARHGIAWRVRNEGGAWVQTVKTLGDGPLARGEHNAPVPRPADPAGIPRPDPVLHAGSTAGRQLAKVLAGARAAPVATYGTEFERVARDIPLPGGAMEVALDVGRVVARRGGADEVSEPLCELELELKQGSVPALVAAATQWARTHGLVLSTLSKAERGERLRAGQAAGPAAKAGPVRAPKGHLPAGQDLQRAVVAHCLEQILANASEIAHGHADDRHIHQLRVGLRRLRTALREFDRVAPGRFDPAWQAPLRTAFRRLGTLRDGGHVLERIGEALRQAGTPAVDTGGSPSESPQHIVADAAFQSTLVALMGFAATPGRPPQARSSEERGLDADATRRALRKALRKLHRGIAEDAASFGSLPAERRHGVRKRVKRLRYLAEFLAPALKGGGKDFLRHLEPAQDALGRLNDEQVAEARYRQLAAKHPKAWFAVGWLAARREPLLAECERALGRLKEGPEVRKGGFRQTGDGVRMER
ncbi:CYTH and CHAD domain-containing protein [Paracidovorax avenae]